MAGLRRLLEASDGLSTAATPTTNRTSGGADTPQANFDTNMVIILAALLCALICALGLNSMVRCFMRCSHRFGFESSQQAAARTGLKKSALKKIPIFVHGSDKSDSSLGSISKDSSLNSECPICLGEFIDGEKIRVLPKCNHTFHVRCIDTWLVSHSSCPNCRHSLLESFKPSTATTSGGQREVPPRQDGREEEQVVVVQVNDVS